MNAYNSEMTYERGLSINMPGLMRDVYAWMAIALLVTGATAWIVADSPLLLGLIFASKFGTWGLLIATIALVWHLSAAVTRLSLKAATAMFLIYSVLNGLTMSAIFILYTFSSISAVFLTTAGTFAVMSVYGYMTKTDLSRVGSLCLMALFGVIIATVVNLFLENTMLQTILSYAGILIFVGLTAYDTARIREIAMTHDTSATDDGQKIAIMGALTLYLDFINLFLYMLRIFGDRK